LQAYALTTVFQGDAHDIMRFSRLETSARFNPSKHDVAWLHSGPFRSRPAPEKIFPRPAKQRNAWTRWVEAVTWPPCRRTGLSGQKGGIGLRAVQIYTALISLQSDGLREKASFAGW